jgi:hypothetical protein
MANSFAFTGLNAALVFGPRRRRVFPVWIELRINTPHVSSGACHRDPAIHKCGALLIYGSRAQGPG